MKTYINPMLLVISIKKNDILTQSVRLSTTTQNNGDALAPGQRGFDDWDAGY